MWGLPVLAVQIIVWPLTLRYWPENWLMRTYNGTFFMSDALLVLHLLLVFFRLRSLAIWAAFRLSGSCSPSKLLDGNFVGCESGNFYYFRYAQSSRRPTTQYYGNLFTLPHTNDNRLNHRPWTELENNQFYKPRQSWLCKVSFKKLKIYRLCWQSAIFEKSAKTYTKTYAKTYARTIALHAAGAREIWIDQSRFSRREKLYFPDVNVS